MTKSFFTHTVDYLPFSIEHIGFSDDVRVTKFGPAKRNHYIIHYILSGKGTFNGYKLSAGQGFLITPGMFEEYHSDPSDPWHFLWIVGTDKNMDKIFRMIQCDTDLSIFNYGFKDKLFTIEKKLALLEKLSPCEAIEIFMSIIKNHEKEDSKNNDKDSYVFFTYAKKYIETNYHNKITVKEIAEKIGISSVYLFKIFVRETGKSPKQYINDYRIQQAEMLLSDTDLSVSEIGKSVGYDDILTFSKFFSVHTGKSPSEFRKIVDKPLHM